MAGRPFYFPGDANIYCLAFHGVKASIKVLPKTYHPAGKVTNYVFWLVLAGTFLFTSGARAYANLKNDRKINGPFDQFSADMFN